MILAIEGELKSKINFVFIVSFGSLGHLKSSFGNYFNSRVAIHEKIGFEIGIFPLFGLCHCGLAKACCDVGYGEDCSICPRNTISRYKAKAVLFRILFSSINCVQPLCGSLNKQGFQYFKLCHRAQRSHI